MNPDPKDDAPYYHPASTDSALNKLVGEQPSASVMSMAEGAAMICERLGADATQPDIQVLAWGWAATTMEAIRLQRERVRQLDLYARDHCGGNYDEAQFKIANSGKYKRVESRIRALRRELEEYEESLVQRMKGIREGTGEFRISGTSEQDPPSSLQNQPQDPPTQPGQHSDTGCSRAETG